MDECIVKKVLPDSERRHLKEERKIRNKQKREQKRIEKQQENKRREDLFRIQPQGSNVTIITKDFANHLLPTEVPRANSCLQLRNEDFPALGSKSKFLASEFQWSNELQDQPEIINPIERRLKKKNDTIKVDIFELISSERCLSHITNKCTDSSSSTPTPYAGNMLDSSLPKRMEGKHREDCKSRKSKFKNAILYDREIFEKMHINIDGHFDDDSDQNEKCCMYCDNVIKEELEDSVAEFLQKIVNLQEKMYKKNPRNGKIKRRYVVGFKEVQKYLILNKIKFIVITTDLDSANVKGALSDTINNISDLATSKNIPYVFALKRRCLGRITLKYLPISCIGVINYSSIEETFGKLLEDVAIAKREFQDIIHQNENKKVDEINLPLLENLKIALQEK